MQTSLIFLLQDLYCTMKYGPTMKKFSKLFWLGQPEIIYYKKYVAAGYEPVLQQFKKQMEEGEEIGAQCCAYYQGKKVIDLCAHQQNNLIAPNNEYNEQSLQCIFSAGKNIESIVVALLVDQGKLDYLQKVCFYWPEFGQNGKENITIADVLRHEAGMPLFEYKDIPLENQNLSSIKKNQIGEYFEKKCPEFDKDSPRFYHAMTRGLILNEIVRRVDSKKRTIGEILKEEVQQKLQLNCYIGVPEPLIKKVSNLQFTPIIWDFLQSLVPKMFGRRVLVDYYFWYIRNKIKYPLNINDKNGYNHGTYNSNEFRKAEISSSNVHSDAESMAKIASLMAQKGEFQGKQLISLKTWEAMHASAQVKVDKFFQATTKFTQGGFNIFDLDQQIGRLVGNTNSFCGWNGYGGSMLLWHPEQEIGFGYTMNLLEYTLQHKVRGTKLLNKVYECTVNNNIKKK